MLSRRSNLNWAERRKVKAARSWEQQCASTAQSSHNGYIIIFKHYQCCSSMCTPVLFVLLWVLCGENFFLKTCLSFIFHFAPIFCFHLSHASFDGAMPNRKTAKQKIGFKGETSEFENGSDAQGCFFATSYGPLVFFYLLLSFSTK